MKISRNLHGLFFVLVNAILWAYVESSCTNATKKYCDGSTFDPPDMFQLLEGPTGVKMRGYSRGLYITAAPTDYPSHCGSGAANNYQFQHLSTKFQQIGEDLGDSTNLDDWYYFGFEDNDANRYKMQQVLIQGSFEGCINQIYWYLNSSSWYFYRRLYTVDIIVDSDTGAQSTQFNLKKHKSLLLNSQAYIPCSTHDLYFEPYSRFFFYYNYQQSKIVITDRGFTTSTGDACSTDVTPTSVTLWNQSISGYSSLTDPAFYKGFTYFGADVSSTTYSKILKWTVSLDSAGTTLTNSGFTSIYTSSAGYQIRSLVAMDDVGLFFIYSGQNGYYQIKLDETTGLMTGSVVSFNTTKSWALFQTRFNNLEDYRPVYMSPSDAPGVLYKATNVLTLHFTTNNTQYDFHTYPTDIGRYYMMQMRPGTCAQEGGGSEDYDYVHVNMMSLVDKAHVYCVDDSDDIYCGNGKWEEYNLEDCDDGDNTNSDGCSSACLVETRWVCVNAVNDTSN